MQITDSHCHAAHFYYEPIEPALDSLLRNGVEKALLIPLGMVDSLNPYLLECAQRFRDAFLWWPRWTPASPGRLPNWKNGHVGGPRGSG